MGCAHVAAREHVAVHLARGVTPARQIGGEIAREDGELPLPAAVRAQLVGEPVLLDHGKEELGAGGDHGAEW
jgi:hypothetical protein